MQNISEILLNAVYPKHCVVCGVEGNWVCASCHTGLDFDQSTLCRICKKAGRGGICKDCAQYTGVNSVLSLYPYTNETVRSVIKAAKYTGSFDILKELSPLWREYVISKLNPRHRYTATYIPQHREKLLERGYNQSQLLCKLLFEDIVPVKNLLIKKFQTEAQAEKSRSARRKNIQDSIVALAEVPENLILVDDVITTGATVREAAKALRTSGAKKIVVVTIAHG